MAQLKKISTLENIQEAAHDLFLCRGFSATSVDDICREANITKGGFFHHFKSKECLAKAVLKKFCLTAREKMSEARCCKSLSDPLDRVFASLECVPSRSRLKTKRQGCLITTFIQEMSQSNPEIQSMCVDGLKEWATMLKKDLKLARDKYNPHLAVDIDSLADHCVAVVQGAQVLAKATGRCRAVDESIGHLKQYLRFVFKSTKSRRVS